MCKILSCTCRNIYYRNNLSIDWLKENSNLITIFKVKNYIFRKIRIGANDVR